MSRFDQDVATWHFLKGLEAFRTEIPGWWTSEHAELYRWLKSKTTELANIYQTSALIMEAQNFPGRITLVGHAIREIRNGLHNIAVGHIVSDSEDKDECRNKKSLSHREKSRRFLKEETGLEPTDYALDHWVRVSEYAHKLAHFPSQGFVSIDKAQRLDEDLQNMWRLFGESLAHLSQRSFENLDKIDVLLQETNTQEPCWTHPNEQQISKFGSLVAIRLVNRTYFFDRLDNPNWLTAPTLQGIFQNPPDRVRGEDKWLFLPWPEGRYLARMAPTSPDDVLGLIKEQQKSDNPMVTGALLEAVSCLPNEKAKEIAPKVEHWCKGAFPDWFAPQASDAVITLLEAGEIETAQETIKYMLDFGSCSEMRSGFVGNRGVTTRINAYEYERFVNMVLPDLVDKAGLEGVRVFSSMLKDAMSSKTQEMSSQAAALLKEQEVSPKEAEIAEAAQLYFHLRRKTIEDSDENSRCGFYGHLISATCDAATRFAALGESELDSVISELERGGLLHKRIAVHVLANSSYGHSLVAEKFEGREWLDDSLMCQEYRSLLRNRYSELPDATQQHITDLVLAGPNVDGYQPNQIQIEKWQLYWLELISDHLTEETLVFYQTLADAHGNLTRLERRDPVQIEEMRTWSISKTVQYLSEWSDTQSSVWGLAPLLAIAQNLEQITRIRAQEFSERATDFVDLNPVYVSSLLSGLRRALDYGACIDWDQTIELVSSVAEAPFTNDPNRQDNFALGGWQQARRAGLSLLCAAIRKRPNMAPFDMRERIWDIILRCTKDPDPSPDSEAAALTHTNFGPVEISLNTTRPQAVCAAVDYAWWCTQQLAAANQSLETSFALVPEARDVLEHHLNTNNDPSIAVRSVYGQKLPLLILLDNDWASEHIPAIFPSSVGLSDYRDAAWDGYISRCDPSDFVYEIIKDEYVKAVERYPSSQPRPGIDPDVYNTKLGEHLVWFLWNGLAPLSLVLDWFTRAEDETAAHVMYSIGERLQALDEPPEKSVQEKIQGLWNERLSTIKAYTKECYEHPHKLEAEAFVSSFYSMKLDPEWSLAGMEDVIESGAVNLLTGWSIDVLVDKFVDTIASTSNQTSPKNLATNARRQDYCGLQRRDASTS